MSGCCFSGKKAFELFYVIKIDAVPFIHRCYDGDIYRVLRSGCGMLVWLPLGYWKFLKIVSKIIFLLAYDQLSIMSFFQLMDWILCTSGMGKTLCCRVKGSPHFNAILNKAFPGNETHHFAYAFIFMLNLI